MFSGVLLILYNLQQIIGNCYSLFLKQFNLFFNYFLLTYSNLTSLNDHVLWIKSELISKYLQHDVKYTLG